MDDRYVCQPLPPWIDGNIPTKAPDARGTVSTLRTQLIGEIVEKGWRVADIFCGVGLDIGKWVRAGVSHCTFIDPRVLWLQETESKVRKRGSAFQSNLFLAEDPAHSAELSAKTVGAYDAIACFERFEAAFESETTLRVFLSSIAAMLRSGGFFFGTILDPAAAFRLCTEEQSATQTALGRSALFKLTVPLGWTQKNKGEVFGQVFDLVVTGEEHDRQVLKDSYVEWRYLVDFPTLIQIASELGLELVDAPNLADMLREYGEQYKSTLSSYRVHLDSDLLIPADQLALLGLFCAFIFKKR